MCFQMGLGGYKCVACFGLMHMFATNVCILIRTVVKETLRDLTQLHRDNATLTHLPNNSADISAQVCTAGEMYKLEKILNCWLYLFVFCFACVCFVAFVLAAVVIFIIFVAVCYL